MKRLLCVCINMAIGKLISNQVQSDAMLQPSLESSQYDSESTFRINNLGYHTLINAMEA